MNRNWENRDCCELLSAYLDGEVTAEERQQVETWLATDPRIKELHQRLLKLHHGCQTLPGVEQTDSYQKMATSVFEKIDQRNVNRKWLITGGAIAAVVLGAVSNLVFSEQSPMPQIATNKPAQTASEPLKIALNRPVVPIPTAAAMK